MFWELAGVPAVAVRRGARVESVHHVAACVSDADGDVVLRVGTVEEPVFLRSSAKPFIAAASVRAGVLERFGFGERELAVMCASHNGEPGHVELVASMLERIGATVDDLGCGAHPPSYEPAAAALAARGEPPTQLHNNCSGKHAGILALAKVLGAPFAGYLEPSHPAQRAILALCERVSDDVFDADKLGVDGCGIPVYATTLRNAALSFARFATLAGWRTPTPRRSRGLPRRCRASPGTWRDRPLRHRPDARDRRAVVARRAPRASTATRCWTWAWASRSRSSTARAGPRRPPAGDPRGAARARARRPQGARAARLVAVKNVAGRVVGEVAALADWVPAETAARA